MSYERLTPRDIIEAINMPQDGDLTRFIGYAMRLHELENQIEKGDYIKLLCKPGDTVYHIWRRITDVRLDEFIIRSIEISSNGITLICGSTDDRDYGKYHLSLLDEDLFFDKSKAEAKLKELRSKN